MAFHSPPGWNIFCYMTIDPLQVGDTGFGEMPKENKA
jgi:hypothetical protein